MKKLVLFAPLLICLVFSGCVRREPGITVGIYFAVSTEEISFTDAVERDEIEIPYLPLDKTCQNLILRINDSYTKMHHTSPMDRRIVLQNLYIENDVVYIIFNDSYNEMRADKRVQTEMCITLTLCELEGIRAVNISTETQPNEMLYTAETFVTSFATLRLKDYETTLFFPSEDGTGLIPETRIVHVEEDADPAAAIAQALLDGRTDSDGNTVTFAAAGTTLLSASVIEPVCYVDLSKEFLMQPNRNADGLSLTLYAFVNSLAEIEGVEAVQFMIDGRVTGAEIAPMFTHPFTPVEELVLEP